MCARIKSLHIDTERTWRGGEQQVLFLARGLAARGHPPTVVCQPGSPLLERCRESGLESVGIRMRGEFDAVAVARLASLMRLSRYDIVHMHTAHAHALGCLAALMSGNPKKIVARRVDFSTRRGPLSLLKYRLPVDRYIAVSRAVKNVLVRDGIPPERISVVHSGVDPQRLEGASARDLAEEFRLGGDVIKVGNIAHMADHKGQKFLIGAIPMVLEKHPNVMFFIVGEGELWDELHELARKLKAEANVIFTGFRQDIARLLAFFDILVTASHMDGFGTSLMEAMAMAKPIVATSAGGIPEIVQDGEEALIVPPKDSRALAQGIISLIENSALRATLGAAARERVGKHFGADAMAENTLAVYREVLGR